MLDSTVEIMPRISMMANNPKRSTPYVNQGRFT